jgi:hypothetical protein
VVAGGARDTAFVAGRPCNMAGLNAPSCHTHSVHVIYIYNQAVAGMVGYNPGGTNAIGLSPHGGGLFPPTARPDTNRSAQPSRNCPRLVVSAGRKGGGALLSRGKRGARGAAPRPQPLLSARDLWPSPPISTQTRALQSLRSRRGRKGWEHDTPEKLPPQQSEARLL